MKCFGCGVEKTLNNLETYPYPSDGFIDEPIEPLMVLECSGEEGYRVVVVCHECFHKLEPDMWIDQRNWEYLNPVIPYESLPLPNPDINKKCDPESYLIES